MVATLSGLLLSRFYDFNKWKKDDLPFALFEHISCRIRFLILHNLPRLRIFCDQRPIDKITLNLRGLDSIVRGLGDWEVIETTCQQSATAEG